MRHRWFKFGRHKRQKAIVSILLVFLLTGCLKTPETEFVTNKEGQSTLISDHSAVDEGIPIREQVQASETVTENIEVENKYVDLKIDAEVFIPETTALPAYQFASMEFTPENIEAFVTGFFDDGAFYNGHPSYTARSKENVYQEIEELEEEIEAIEDGSAVVDGQDVQESVEIRRQMIAARQEELKDLPDRSPTYGDPVHYEMQEFERDLYYYDSSIQDSVAIPYHYNAAFFTGMRGDQEYSILFEKDAWNSIISITIAPDTNHEGTSYGNLTTNLLYRGEDVKQNQCRYSVEEAAKMCREVLALAGMEDVELGRTIEAELLKSGISHGEFYYLSFLPSVNGVTDVYLREVERSSELQTFGYYSSSGVYNLSSQSMYNWKVAGNEEAEFIVPEEPSCASFAVGDDGILKVEIDNPKVRGDLLAENVKLLEFDQVVEQGVNQLKNVYADIGIPSNRYNILVKAIELNYALMQSPENPNEYIMIPVWDFKSGKNGEVYVTINAIDGTVFERHY